MKTSTVLFCRHGVTRNDCPACLRQERDFLQDRLKKQETEIDRLGKLVKTLADRVTACSELLSGRNGGDEARAQGAVSHGRTSRPSAGR
jgi:hypothetical protein